MGNEVETTLHVTIIRSTCLCNTDRYLLCTDYPPGSLYGCHFTQKVFTVCYSCSFHKLQFGKSEMVPTYSWACLSTEGFRHTPFSEFSMGHFLSTHWYLQILFDYSYTIVFFIQLHRPHTKGQFTGNRYDCFFLVVSRIFHHRPIFRE